MQAFNSNRSFPSYVIACLSAAAMIVGMSDVVAQSYGLTQRPMVGAFLNGTLPPAEASATGWQAAVAFPNITFERPISIVAEPGSNRLLVGEQGGKIWAFEENPAVSNKTLFLDLTAATDSSGAGLLGIAFHPEYGIPGSTNRGYVYVFYTYSPVPGSGSSDTTPAYQRISRFTVPNGTNVATLGSEQVLINQFDRHQWHAGGGLFFGADGFLYISVGDEGGNYDAYNQTQKINSGLFSGVLRVDVNKDPAKSHPIRRQPLSGGNPPNGWPASYSGNYFIPNDNPWLATNGTLLEEFYAIGLRSPHRMSQDPANNRIWLGDVGQATWEEVDIIEKGGNYQWVLREGSHLTYHTRPAPPISYVEKLPVLDYAHSDGNNCVIGGYVYRGAAYPDLMGKYIYGDNGSGRIWSMNYDGINPTTVTQLCVMPAPPNSDGLASFGLDHNNEILMSVMGYNVSLYRLTAVGVAAPPPPNLLSQTGVFADPTNLVPHPGLIPFTVTAPLWSDNAEKYRWMAIPSNGVIGFSTNGNWTFPSGTVMVKHFELPMDDTNPAVRKRLETRLLVHATNNSWYGLTYKWRADNTDADLLPGSLNETNLVLTSTGVRTQVWYYPSRQDCRTCHTANAGNVLGPSTLQLNGDHLYPGTSVTDNQLRALNHIGMFNVTLNEPGIAAFAKAAHLKDTNASPELRVRSYLQANCAHCHQPGGVQAFFDTRFATPLPQTGMINATPTSSLDILGARIIAPQDTARSVLHIRDGLVGTNQMPPLAKNMVDTNYINVLTQWINSLPVPPLPAPSVLGRIGNTNTSATSDLIWDNGAYINAARFTAASNMTIAFIHANIVGVTGRYQTAIYTDNAAQPASLLTASLAITNPATGWRQFALPSPINLTSNTSYWLAIWSDSSSAKVFYASTGGTLRWGQYNFGDWPNPIATSGGNIFNYNIYASGGSGPTFNTTPGNRIIAEFTPLTVTNTATDADTPFQKVGYALANAPAGATISSNGIITWIPGEAQGPSTNQIITVANDSIVAITNSFQVIVTEVNGAPVAFSQSLTNAEDNTLPILLTGSDPDGPALNYLVLTNPIHGNLTGIPPNLTYVPNSNFFGSDGLTFTAHDGSLTSAWAVITINITNVNDLPAPLADQFARWLSQGLTISTTSLLTNDTDADGDLLTLQSVSSPTLEGASVSLTNTSIRYWPASGNTNADSFTYLVSDGLGGSATGTVSITVMPEPPITELLGIADTGGEYLLSFNGVPGFTYTVQYTDSLEPASWQSLGTVVADQSGNAQIVDDTPGNGSTRFYRAVRGIVP
jgi:uncharacterized repeat protein (TIGR03806 family)